MTRRRYAPLALIGVILTSGAPLAAQVVYGNTNLVAAANGGRVVTFSSQWEDRGRPVPRWQVTNLIDGRVCAHGLPPADSFGWMSQTSPRERAEWIVFGFAEDRPRTIGMVALDPRTADPPTLGRGVRDFRISVSTTEPDGPWEDVFTGALANRPVRQTFTFEPALARFVKLTVITNHGSDQAVELAELEVYEGIIPHDDLTRIIADADAVAQRLERYRDARGSEQQPLPLRAEDLDLKASLLAAANGGVALGATSEALGPDGKPAKRWAKENLIDGQVVLQPGTEGGSEPYGWSSERAPDPTSGQAEQVWFQLPGDSPQLVDTVLIDPRTPEPALSGRQARSVVVYFSTVGPDTGWVRVATREDLPEDAPTAFRFMPREAKYVMLEVTANWGSDRYVVLGEFALYRTAAPEANPLADLSARLRNLIGDLTQFMEEERKGAGSP